MKKMIVLCVGGLMLMTALCQAQTGSVQVTILPAGANTSGAQWNVDGGVRQNSIATNWCQQEKPFAHFSASRWRTARSKSARFTSDRTCAKQLAVLTMVSLRSPVGPRRVNAAVMTFSRHILLGTGVLFSASPLAETEFRQECVQ